MRTVRVLSDYNWHNQLVTVTWLCNAIRTYQLVTNHDNTQNFRIFEYSTVLFLLSIKLLPLWICKTRKSRNFQKYLPNYQLLSKSLVNHLYSYIFMFWKKKYTSSDKPLFVGQWFYKICCLYNTLIEAKPVSNSVTGKRLDMLATRDHRRLIPMI